MGRGVCFFLRSREFLGLIVNTGRSRSRSPIHPRQTDAAGNYSFNERSCRTTHVVSVVPAVVGPTSPGRHLSERRVNEGQTTNESTSFDALPYLTSASLTRLPRYERGAIRSRSTYADQSRARRIASVDVGLYLVRARGASAPRKHPAGGTAAFLVSGRQELDQRVHHVTLPASPPAGFCLAFRGLRRLGRDPTHQITRKRRNQIIKGAGLDRARLGTPILNL